MNMFNHITILEFSWYSIRTNWINTLSVQLEDMAIISLVNHRQVKVAMWSDDQGILVNQKCLVANFVKHHFLQVLLNPDFKIPRETSSTVCSFCG